MVASAKILLLPSFSRFVQHFRETDRPWAAVAMHVGSIFGQYLMELVQWLQLNRTVAGSIFTERLTFYTKNDHSEVRDKIPGTCMQLPFAIYDHNSTCS